jgi:VIT1/CCC1 family predicted Fe2+/Mn2+ transporter
VTLLEPDELREKAPDAGTTKRVLDSQERIGETLFGLIMVLTFTGSLNVAESGDQDVRIMLIGALGCNFAWGVIDALFYLMGTLSEKSRNLELYRAVRGAADPRQARQLIRGGMPPLVAGLLDRDELDSVHRRLLALPAPPRHASLNAKDWRGALGVFLLVFIATFPVAIPFMIMEEIGLAMRLSNGIAVALLFIAGVAYGRCIGRRPLLTGAAMVIFGAIVVAFTIALGG